MLSPIVAGNAQTAPPEAPNRQAPRRVVVLVAASGVEQPKRRVREPSPRDGATYIPQPLPSPWPDDYLNSDDNER